MIRVIETRVTILKLGKGYIKIGLGRIKHGLLLKIKVRKVIVVKSNGTEI